MNALIACVIGMLAVMGAICVLAVTGIVLGLWVPYCPNDG